MSSPSAGPIDLYVEEQQALLREEQLQHVADMMDSDKDETLLQALEEVERLPAVPMDNESLHLTFAHQNTPLVEKAPAQVDGGGHFRFVLDPVIERRSNVMGVRERIFRTRLEQQGRQNINNALARVLRGAVETLLDDATIHDRVSFLEDYSSVGSVRNRTR